MSKLNKLWLLRSKSNKLKWKLRLLNLKEKNGSMKLKWQRLPLLLELLKPEQENLEKLLSKLNLEEIESDQLELNFKD